MIRPSTDHNSHVSDNKDFNISQLCALVLHHHTKWENQASPHFRRGDLTILPLKFEHIFVAVITFFPLFLYRYFYYQLVAYCVCFKMICEMSL